MKSAVLRSLGKRFFLIDVVSLYPSSMLKRRYPIGKIIRNATYEETIANNRIGFFWCKFDQVNLSKNILPNLENKGDKYDWNYKGEQRVFLPSVDIQSLQLNKCETLIESNESISWAETISGADLFSHLLEAFKLKQL